MLWGGSVMADMLLLQLSGRESPLEVFVVLFCCSIQRARKGTVPDTWCSHELRASISEQLALSPSDLVRNGSGAVLPPRFPKMLNPHETACRSPDAKAAVQPVIPRPAIREPSLRLEPKPFI